MSHCFIFFDAAHYQPNGDFPEALWAVRLDDEGGVDIALSEHTLEDIQEMQQGAETIVVLPASVASIHLLDLPKLSMRKAREAIPYALEEALAEPVQELQIAFDRDEENPLQYRVVAVNKLRLATWISALGAAGLGFDALTLDWCALESREACATDTDLLVSVDAVTKTANGALSPMLAKAYMKAENELSGFSFDDSLSELRFANFSETTGSYRLFIATRLLSIPFLNLCQGDFQRKSLGRGRTYWYAVCGALLGVWFLSVLGVNGILLHQLHAKEALVDEEIKTLYFTFFPEATQVISPRFRIERLLQQNTGGEVSPFWTLLDKFSKVVSIHPLEVEHFQFHDEHISVNLIAGNFAELEAFEDQLKKQGVSVKQIEASTRDEQVVSTLELQL